VLYIQYTVVLIIIISYCLNLINFKNNYYFIQILGGVKFLYMVYARKIVINYLACVLEDWYSFKDTCVSQKIIYCNKNTSIPGDIISNKV